jgi:hypothetical protein
VGVAIEIDNLVLYCTSLNVTCSDGCNVCCTVTSLPVAIALAED